MECWEWSDCFIGPRVRSRAFVDHLDRGIVVHASQSLRRRSSTGSRSWGTFHDNRYRADRGVSPIIIVGSIF
jgi:hypothetical protein